MLDTRPPASTPTATGTASAHGSRRKNWISTMKTADGNSELRLQYLQDVSIGFPSTLHPEVPIVWPHIGLNTLYRVPEGA